MMPVVPIEDIADPRVSEYLAVSEPDLARELGLFVAEGRLVVRRLLEATDLTVRSLLLSHAARLDLAPALASLPPGVPIYVCKADRFRGITGVNIHRGCLALVERPVRRPAEEVIRSARLVVVLEQVANADNIGSVFRNAAAFGADAVLLSPGCCDPLYRKAVRTSMAATLRVPFASLEPWPDALDDLKRHGFTMVALTPRAPAEPLDVAVPARGSSVALLVGNEGSGLSEAVERAADIRVRIPIRYEVDSLNLSVATGIALSRLAHLASLT
jgi:tRNA G18 (ribose-2'-O)-methylase SpoU